MNINGDYQLVPYYCYTKCHFYTHAKYKANEIYYSGDIVNFRVFIFFFFFVLFTRGQANSAHLNHQNMINISVRYSIHRTSPL